MSNTETICCRGVRYIDSRGWSHTYSILNDLVVEDRPQSWHETHPQSEWDEGPPRGWRPVRSEIWYRPLSDLRLRQDLPKVATTDAGRFKECFLEAACEGGDSLMTFAYVASVGGVVLNNWLYGKGRKQLLKEWLPAAYESHLAETTSYISAFEDAGVCGLYHDTGVFGPQPCAPDVSCHDDNQDPDMLDPDPEEAAA